MKIPEIIGGVSEERPVLRETLNYLNSLRGIEDGDKIVIQDLYDKLMEENIKLFGQGESPGLKSIIQSKLRYFLNAKRDS